MDKDITIIKDVNGDSCIISNDSIRDTLLANNTSFLGMSMRAIIALKSEYMKRCGPLPPTPESIREIFNG